MSRVLDGSRGGHRSRHLLYDHDTMKGEFDGDIGSKLGLPSFPLPYNANQVCSMKSVRGIRGILSPPLHLDPQAHSHSIHQSNSNTNISLRSPSNMASYNGNGHAHNHGQLLITNDSSLNSSIYSHRNHDHNNMYNAHPAPPPPGADIGSTTWEEEIHQSVHPPPLPATATAISAIPTTIPIPAMQVPKEFYVDIRLLYLLDLYYII